MPSTGVLGKQVFEFDSYYLSVNNTLNNNYWTLSFHKISKQGDSLDSWNLNADTNVGSFVWNPQSFVRKNNKNYLVGSIRDTNNGNKIKGFFAVFNDSFTQVLSYKNYDYESYTKLTSIEEVDSHFICGVVKAMANGKQYFSLIKLDMSGEIIWEKDFKDTKNLFNTSIHGVTKTFDNGFVLWSGLWNNNTIYGHDIDSAYTYYIKVDSIGNEQWRKRIGSNKTNNNGTIPLQLADSSFIIVWSDNLLNGYQAHEHQLNDSSTMYISRINQFGRTLWEKNLHDFLKVIDTPVNSFYSNFYPYHIWDSKILKDGALGIVGNTVGHGFFLKIKDDGIPIWYRKYYPLQLPKMSITEYSENSIVDMVETSDGGFLLNGWSHYKGQTVPSWGRKSTFIYKTDSYGCISRNCYTTDKWYIDSVKKVEDSLQTIRDSIADAHNRSNKGNVAILFPNPTNGNLTVKIPTSYEFNSPVLVSLVSANGKTVHSSYKLTGYTSHIELNVLRGIYLLKLEGDGFNEIHKVVIQ